MCPLSVIGLRRCPEFSYFMHVKTLCLSLYPDVDECADRKLNDCDTAPKGKCHNVHGSYVCRCLDGYRMCQEKNRCEGKCCVTGSGPVMCRRKGEKQEPVIAVEPRKPPMTNKGTETAFRHDHCKHFEKVNILWGQRSVDAMKLVYTCRCSTTSTYKLSVQDFDPKGTSSKVRVHAGLYLGTGCWSIAKNSRISTKFSSSSSRSFDHHSKTKKEIVKNAFEKWKKTSTSSEVCEKNWWRCYRLRMRGCMRESCKREVGKEMLASEVARGGGGGATKCPQEHLRVPT